MSSHEQLPLGHSKLKNTTIAVLRHGQSLANVAGIICSNPSIACHQYGLSPLGHQQAIQAGHDIVDYYCQKSRSYATLDPSSGSNLSNTDSQGCCAVGTDATLDHHANFSGIVLLSSDLLRAKETAETVYQVIAHHNNQIASSNPQEQQRNDGSNKTDTSTSTIIVPIYQNKVVLDIRLRERSFGNWDGTSDTNYNKVWEQDAKDASHTQQNVESVQSVMSRTMECVTEWDRRLNDNNNGNGQQHQHYLLVLVAHGDVLQILQTALEQKPGTMHRSSIPHLETATLRIVSPQKHKGLLS